MSTIKTNQLAHTANGAATYTLPQTDGSAGQVLKTDGSGNLSWVTLTDTNDYVKIEKEVIRYLKSYTVKDIVELISKKEQISKKIIYNLCIKNKK